jgi:hypothetical protein
MIQQIEIRQRLSWWGKIMSNGKSMATGDLSVRDGDAGEKTKVVFCTLEEFAKISAYKLQFLKRQARAGCFGAVKVYDSRGINGYRYEIPIKDKRRQERLALLKADEFNRKKEKLIEEQNDFRKKLSARIREQNSKTKRKFREIFLAAKSYGVILDQPDLIKKIEIEGKGN